MPLRACDARYGRALASFGPAPIATHTAFAPIAGADDRATRCSAAVANARVAQCTAAVADKRLLRGASLSLTSARPPPVKGKGKTFGKMFSYAH